VASTTDPAPQTEVTRERTTESGYEVGLSADTKAGEVQVGVAVEQAEVADLAIGLSLTAPRAGSLSVGIVVEDNGAARVGWLTRLDDSGRPTPEVASPEVEFRKRVQVLDELLVRERARAKAAEEAIARLREVATHRRSEEQQRTTTVENRLAGTEAKLGEANKQVVLLEARLDEMEKTSSAFERSRQEVQIAADVAAKAKNEELGRAKAEIASLVKKLGEREAEVAHLREAAMEAREAARDLEAARGGLETAETRVTELLATLEETRESGRVIADELEKSRAEATATRESLEGARIEVARLTETEHGLRGELESTREFASSLQAQLADEARSREEQIAASRESLAQAEEKALSLEMSLRDKEHALSTIRTDLKSANSAKERSEATVAARDEEIGALRATVSETGQRLREAEAELASRAARISELEDSFARAVQRAAELETANNDLEARLGDLSAQLDETGRQRDDVVAKAERLGKQLEAEQTVSSSRLAGIEEEQKHQQELLQDIAFIRSQVADLSTSKGALLARLETMAKREEQRKSAASAMALRLRDAEVLAADRTTAMRKLEARIQSLEAERKQNQGLRGELEEARRLEERVAELVSERDGLKTDIMYFQRQIAALKRDHSSGTPEAPSRSEPPPEEITAIGLDLPAEWSVEPTTDRVPQDQSTQSLPSAAEVLRSTRTTESGRPKPGGPATGKPPGKR
jgi:chromosome segregation ATPase